MKIRFLPIVFIFSLSVCACCCFLILPACNKGDTTSGNIPNNSNTLTPFSVTVLERTSISAVIQWDTSFNHSKSEQVKYKVVLEGVVLDTGLTRMSDTLLNLQKNKTYRGKVVAYITGDSTFAEFSLSDYEGFFYASTSTNSYGAPFQLGYFNSYPDPGLQIQPSIWRVNAGILLEPTLSNDTLFIISDNRLKAINAHTGNLIWQTSSTYVFNSPATYYKGRLYACGTGALLCFDGSNGQLLWTYRSNISYIDFVSTPVVNDNRVLVASRSSAGEISCVDAYSGGKIWSYDISHSTCSRPLVVNGIVVFIIAMAGRVVAFNQNTGTVVWDRRDFGAVGSDQFNPVYIDGKVIVHTNGRLSALDLKTGFEKWTYDRGSTKSACVAGRGRVYFCQDSVAGYDQNAYHRNLLCLDAKDGSFIWRQDSKASGHKYGRLVFGKDKLYAIEEYGFNPDSSRKVVAFNASNGNRDLLFDAKNPVRLARYEHIFDYCVKRDGIVYYPFTHGNYQ